VTSYAFSGKALCEQLYLRCVAIVETRMGIFGATFWPLFGACL